MQMRVRGQFGMYVRSIACYSRAQNVRTHSALILDDGELGSVPVTLRGRLFVSPRDFFSVLYNPLLRITRNAKALVFQ